MAKNRILTGRRAFLLSLGAAVGAGGFAIASRYRQVNNHAQPIGYEHAEFAVSGEAPLRERAAKKGLLYGAATQYESLFQNSKFAEHFAQECAILVPARELKWDALRPSPDRFNFTKADRMAKFALAHDMLLRGHTLVWHKALPRWFEDVVNSQNAEKILIDHIKTVAGHYAGKMHSWDVVNEAIQPSDGRADGLRKTPWLQFLGPDYIDIAFRAAAEADPEALLVYNDHKLEYAKPNNQARRTKVLRLLERLKSSGTPIHALGLQSHLGVSLNDFNPKKLRNFLKDVASLGLKILVTEMDVTEKQPRDVAARDRLIAGIYEDYLSVVLDEPAVSAVITWGLSDRYTWLSRVAPRKDGTPVRPLPLDAKMERKLAWNAIARAFDRAPTREVEHEGDRSPKSKQSSEYVYR